MISTLKVGVRVMLNKDRLGNTRVLLFFSQAYNRQVVAVSLTTQRVCNDVCLSRVIVNF
jgi:hypothetical protein